MFRLHLWLGVVCTMGVLVLCITGILLNHKRALGLMPDVEHSPRAEFSSALGMADLAARAGIAAGEAGTAAGIDRMDVRPRDGLIKVRFRDRDVTEVTLDIHDGRVLHVGQRNDVFLEKLHSGEIFGDRWILLSDVAAGLLIVLIVTGYWLWLFPKTRQ